MQSVSSSIISTSLFVGSVFVSVTGPVTEMYPFPKLILAIVLNEYPPYTAKSTVVSALFVVLSISTLTFLEYVLSSYPFMKPLLFHDVLSVYFTSKLLLALYAKV